jgi:hypothetical protein|nr:MAG TPA: hypothetical protein [Caudoviricetes sp.]
MFEIGDIITLKRDTFLWQKGTTAKVVKLECYFDDKCDIVVEILDTKGKMQGMIGKTVGAMSNMFELQKGKRGLHV